MKKQTLNGHVISGGECHCNPQRIIIRPDGTEVPVSSSK